MKIKPSFRGATKSHAEELYQLAQQLRDKGRSVIALSVGQPNTGTPKEAIHAVKKAKVLYHGYTPAVGIMALRERVALFYKQRYNLKINPNRILITNGASGAFSLAFTGCFDEGQTIGVPLPCYYSYLNTLSILGLNKAEFHPTFAHKFQPTVDDLKALPNKINGLLITSPSNPTGTTIAKDQLKALVQYCEKNNILIHISSAMRGTGMFF